MFQAVEELEPRMLLTATAGWGAALAALPSQAAGRLTAAGLEISVARQRNVYTPNYVVLDSQPRVNSKGGLAPFATSGPTGMTPAKIRHAYGIDQVMFGSVAGDGTGQTIAIVVAYDYPTVSADLHAFDLAFGLPDPPSLTRVSQTGGSHLPRTDPAGKGNDWEIEAALDVQWAHAMAPGASILLVEASSASDSDLIQHAVNYARGASGVVAVTMSFGRAEASTDTSLNSYFTTPSGHAGVTFLAATGDNGAPGEYPAASPNVVAVGGTTLNVDSSGNYISESGWSGSGGSISTYQTQPSYQAGVVTQSTTNRTTPDLAFDADPASGVSIYDSYDYGTTTPWVTVGGTSLSSPCVAGLIAVADQGRSLGAGSLDGTANTLPALYRLPASDYHDVLTGSNGNSAGAGYDLVTGRGSPIASLLIPSLAAAGPFVTATSPTGVQSTALTSLSFSFSEAMDPTSFSVAGDVASFAGPGGANLLSSITGFSWLNGNTTLQVSFAPTTVDGQYTMVIGPQILSSGGAAMDQNLNGVAAEVPADQYTAGFFEAPTAPSGLAAAAASSSQINLTWMDHSANESGFKVERATNSGFTQNLTLVTTTAANVTSYSDSGLAANTTYYYRVRATDAGVDSGNSNTAGPLMPLLQINGDQGFAGQNDQIRVARDLADPSLLDVFLNSVTPTYSVSFGALNMIVINGLGGDDTLTLDLANGAVIPAGGISYDGGTQTSGDSLIIAGSSGNDAVIFASGQATIGSGVVTLTSVENRSFKGGAGNDSLTLGAGSYTFATDLGVDTAHLSLSLADGAQVAFSGVQHLGGLSLTGNAKVTLADGGQSTLVVQSLTLGGTSSLDVADNAVIVDYTGSSPFAGIYSLVASSAGNHWAGNGIVSHTAAGGGSQYAIGVADNSVANLASFAGQTVDGTSVLIRFTYSGDANLDGQVDLTDLSILAGNWQMAGRQWSQGDADYSGLVDLTDLALLASNWQKVLAGPVAAPVVSLAGAVAPVTQPVGGAPAAPMSAAVAVDAGATTVVPPAETAAVTEPLAAAVVVPVATAGVRKTPLPGAVAGKHPASIGQVRTTPRAAGVFSDWPLPVVSVLVTWPITSQGTQALLWSDGLGVADGRDILARESQRG